MLGFPCTWDVFTIDTQRWLLGVHLTIKIHSIIEIHFLYWTLHRYQRISTDVNRVDFFCPQKERTPLCIGNLNQRHGLHSKDHSTDRVTLESFENSEFLQTEWLNHHKCCWDTLVNQKAVQIHTEMKTVDHNFWYAQERRLQLCYKKIMSVESRSVIYHTHAHCRQRLIESDRDGHCSCSTDRKMYYRLRLVKGWTVVGLRRHSKLKIWTTFYTYVCNSKHLKHRSPD